MQSIKHHQDSPDELLTNPARYNGLFLHQEDSEKPVFVADSAFLRLPQILNLIPIGKSTWWAGVKSGRFPKPVKLGPNITAWRAESIRNLIAELSGEKPQINEVNHA